MFTQMQVAHLHLVPNSNMHTHSQTHRQQIDCKSLRNYYKNECELHVGLVQNTISSQWVNDHSSSLSSPQFEGAVVRRSGYELVV